MHNAELQEKTVAEPLRSFLIRGEIDVRLDGKSKKRLCNTGRI